MIRLKTLLEDANVACPLPKGHAGEIQQYLICKGFLAADQKDSKFGDESAKAVGRFIKNKLKVDPKINSVEDLQSYMKLLGMDTGTPGFGSVMANAVADLIAMLDNMQTLATRYMQNPKFLETVKFVANTLAVTLKGKQANVGNDKYWNDNVAYWSFKIYAEYPTYIDNVKIHSITKRNIVLHINMHIDYYIEIQEYFTGIKQLTKSGRLDLFIEADIAVITSISNGQFCWSLQTNNIVVQSSQIRVPGTTWTVYVKPADRGDASGIMDANIVLNLGSFMGVEVGTINLKTLQPKNLIDAHLAKPKCETFVNLIKKLK